MYERPLFFVCNLHKCQGTYICFDLIGMKRTNSIFLFKIICVCLTETKHLTMRKNITDYEYIDLNLLYNAADCSKEAA